MCASTRDVCQLSSNWRCAAVMGLLLLSVSAVGRAEPASFTFMRVVDTNSQLPNATGNFIAFTDPFATASLDGRPALSIENGTVVFSGSGASGQTGIYIAPVGGSITRIADTNSECRNGRHRPARPDR